MKIQDSRQSPSLKTFGDFQPKMPESQQQKLAEPRRFKNSPALLASAAAIGLVCFGWFQYRHFQSSAAQPSPRDSGSKRNPARLDSVAALGRLEPAGDIRLLAAPITGIGGSPRITELFVTEGQDVRAGQLLARFDNGPGHQAEKELLHSRIANLSRRLELQEVDLRRYRKLMSEGAFAASDLDAIEQRTLEIQGQLQEAQAELAKVNTDLINTELRAPINGTVLRIVSRVGERPGEKGILELGNNQRMEALLEVYESDIGRVRVGQRALITSENGGFSGTIRGTVSRVSPQVRQRQILSTDPSSDADARIVEVRVSLDPPDAYKVRTLTGLKLIARLQA